MLAPILVPRDTTTNTTITTTTTTTTPTTTNANKTKSTTANADTDTDMAIHANTHAYTHTHFPRPWVTVTTTGFSTPALRPAITAINRIAHHHTEIPHAKIVRGRNPGVSPVFCCAGGTHPL